MTTGKRDTMEDIKTITCEHCGQVININDAVTVIDENGEEHLWCDECTACDAYECDRCGDYFTFALDDVETENGVEQWCGHCVEYYAVTCDRCGGFCDHTYTVVDCSGMDVEWCNDCIEYYASWCDHCESYCEEGHDVATVDACSYNGQRHETWCTRCVEHDAVECDDCSQLYEAGAISAYDTSDGERVLCTSCVSDNYYTCDDCGCLVCNDDVEEINGCYYCPSCADDHSSALHSYHHTQGNVFWITANDHKQWWQLNMEESKELYVGVELETDYNDDADDLANDISVLYGADCLECKHDGSLDRNGVEIVSQPMTARAHLDSDMWADVIDAVRRHGGTSHDAVTCGLHMHLSRAAIADRSAYRIDRVFHRFEPQMINFSRRTPSQMSWCRINDDGVCKESTTADRKKKWTDHKRYAGRYEAVNDTNANTVEIRLWRGTLNLVTLRATIEFTAGIAFACNDMSDDDMENVTWDDFKSLVFNALKSNDIPTDDLTAYLARRGL